MDVHAPTLGANAYRWLSQYEACSSRVSACHSGLSCKWRSDTHWLVTLGVLSSGIVSPRGPAVLRRNFLYFRPLCWTLALPSAFHGAAVFVGSCFPPLCCSLRLVCGTACLELYPFVNVLGSNHGVCFSVFLSGLDMFSTRCRQRCQLTQTSCADACSPLQKTDRNIQSFQKRTTSVMETHTTEKTLSNISSDIGYCLSFQFTLCVWSSGSAELPMSSQRQKKERTTNRPREEERNSERERNKEREK